MLMLFDQNKQRERERKTMKKHQRENEGFFGNDGDNTGPSSPKLFFLKTRTGNMNKTNWYNIYIVTRKS